MSIKFPEAKFTINRLVSEHKTASIGEYISFGKDIQSFSGKLPPYMRETRVAFLASFTIQGLPEVVAARAVFHNIFSKIYTAPYNQFNQKILDPKCDLYEFDPKVVFLILDAPDILNKDHFHTLINSLQKNSKALIVVSNFVEHSSSLSRPMNDDLKAVYKNSSWVKIFDFDGFVKTHGKDEIWYTKYKDLGDMRLLPQSFVDLSEALSSFLISQTGATKKCLIFDLDLTIWEGTLSEDGRAGLIPDKKIQEKILSLSKEGVLLAVLSKNDEESALDVFEKHPAMLIGKKDLSAWRINWKPKDQNLYEIARELNLGVDSFVVIDDSPLERAIIERRFPEVAVMAPELLYSYSGFSKSNITEEDQKRKELYDDERKRQDFKESFGSAEDFLQELDIKVEITPVRAETIARTSQLTQKTNQFNMTTRRYSEEDVNDFVRNGHDVITVRAKDRFGDYGIIGVAIVLKEEESWHIDLLLLSCRILGRGIENALIAHIANSAKKSGAKLLCAEFILTSKNAIAKNFYSDSGFAVVEEKNGVTKYELALKGEFQIPSHLTITNDN